MGHPSGALILIGGHKLGARTILKALAQRAGSHGRLAIVAVADDAPAALAGEYRALFASLGVAGIDVLHIRSRDEASERDKVAAISGAAVVLLAGDDQQRLINHLAGSAVLRCLEEIHRRGGTIAGTSAGAAALPETALLDRPSDPLASPRLAPGLALIRGVVIDSHCAGRGRFSRLLGAVQRSRRDLGLGLDADTAVLMSGDAFEVLGSGAVYVVDGLSSSFVELSAAPRERLVRIDDATLHVLGAGDRFDLAARRPLQSAPLSTRAVAWTPWDRR